MKNNEIKYKIEFCNDCMEWRVMRYGNLMEDCMGDRWQQVTLPDKPAYTKYKKVAQRWMEKIIEMRKNYDN